MPSVSKVLSRPVDVAEHVANLVTVAAIVWTIATFPILFAVPLAVAMAALPIIFAYALSAKRVSVSMGLLCALLILLMEIWTYFLIRMAYIAQYGT